MSKFNISEFVKSRRAELGLTTRELASKLNVCASTISKWEKGQIGHIKEDKILLLASALNVSPLILFGYEHVNMEHFTDEQEHRIPLLDILAKDDLFNDHNIVKYISTNKKADFAITAVTDAPNIMKNDTVLFRKVSSEPIPHDSYILVKSDNHQAVIAKAVIISDSLYININGNIREPLKQEEILGIAVELRRDL